jgi:type I restriction enzyme S subunit
MTALLTGNLPQLAGAPNGIKKLRELILELAVRGVLVPQDPSDEPASGLLKRIAEEKTRLVEEGRIRKQKPLAKIAEEEKPFAMPANWEWVRLDALLTKIGAGSTPLGGKQAYVANGVKFLRSQNIWNEGLRMNEVAFISEETHKKMSGTHVEAGDLLFNITGASIGRCAAVPTDFDTGNVSQHVTIIRPALGETQPFLHVVLISQLVQQTVMDVQVGVSREGLSIGKLAQFLIPFPPETEQHRIVAKVNELMALCDRLEAQQTYAESAHAQLVQVLLDSLTQASDAIDFAANWLRLAEHFHTLFTTESSIDALKQALLQLAVMGKLVPQSSSDEPASELLRRINEERSRLVATGQLKKQSLLGHVTDNEQCFPPPNGWAWTRFGATIQSLNNGLYKPAGFYTDSGVISLRMYNIQDGKIVFSDIRRVNIDSDEIDQYRLQAGDLLINRVNSKELVGKTAVIPEVDEPLVYESMNMRARPFVGFVDSLYLNLFMRTRLAKDTLLSHAKEAIGQASLNQGQISSLAMPLPPLAEQHRIVAKVDQLMDLCEQLKTRIYQAQQLNERLASTLVEQAVA